MPTKRHDVFISYASEDRDSFVDALARALRKYSLDVWYDRFSLAPGDRLVGRIEDGLVDSKNGIIVISSAFIRKKWTKHELSILCQRHIEENVRLIPIWLGVSARQVKRLSPTLGGILAIKAHAEEVEWVALQILKAIDPGKYEFVKVLAGIDRPALVRNEIKQIPLSKIKPGPIRHHSLPASIVTRIRNIHSAFGEFYGSSLDNWIDSFRRDLRPEKEVTEWERMLSAFNTGLMRHSIQSTSDKRALSAALLYLSIGGYECLAENVASGEVSERIGEIAREAWSEEVERFVKAASDRELLELQ